MNDSNVVAWTVNSRNITVGSLIEFTLRDEGGPCIYLGRVPDSGWGDLEQSTARAFDSVLDVDDPRVVAGCDIVWSPRSGWLFGIDVEETQPTGLAAGMFVWRLVWLAPEDLLA